MESHTDCPSIQRTPVLESALQRFPGEILGEVFAEVLQDDIADPSSETMRQLTDICLVCTAWRDAATAKHELWRTLELSESLTPQAFEQAQRWLGRAGTLSKGLAVGDRTGHKDHHDKRTDCSLASPAFAKILAEGTIDLYHLTITCASSACTYRLLTLVEEVSRRGPAGGRRSWDGIKSLKLYFLDSNTGGGFAAYPPEDILTSLTYPIFHLLPPLISLSLRLPSACGVEASQYAAPNIPEHILLGLRDVTLACDAISRTALTVLESCRNAERLTLILQQSAGFQDVGRRPLIMPRVRKLRIRPLHRDDGRCHLRNLHLPVLEELDLEFTGRELPFAMEGVICLLQRSQCADTLSQIWLRNARAMDAQRLQIRLPFMKPPYFSAKRHHSDLSSGPLGTWSISREVS